MQGGDILSVLHKTNDDDDEHGPVKEVDCNTWKDETKPEGIHDDPAAVDTEKVMLLVFLCYFINTGKPGNETTIPRCTLPLTRMD